MFRRIFSTHLFITKVFVQQSIVWGETTFLAGAGVGSFKTSGIAPLMNLGLILKYFISEKTSMNFDVREHIAFVGGTNGVQGILYIGLGYAFQLGENKPHGEAPPAGEGDSIDKGI